MMPTALLDDVFIHPASIVETEQIGRGTRIWAFTHVMQGISIGADCNIGEHCFIESGVVIGNNVTIKNGNMLWDGVTLEDGVFVGPNVSFTNDLYPRSPEYGCCYRIWWIIPAGPSDRSFRSFSFRSGVLDHLLGTHPTR